MIESSTTTTATVPLGGDERSGISERSERMMRLSATVRHHGDERDEPTGRHGRSTEPGRLTDARLRSGRGDRWRHTERRPAPKHVGRVWESSYPEIPRHAPEVLG